MKKKVNLFIILLLTSCGFTTGLYEDILDAQEFVKSRNYEKADFAYKKVLSKKPSLKIQIKVNYQLAEINSIYLNKPLQAIKYYKTVINLSLDPIWKVKASERIAALYFENIKDYSAAIEFYKKLMDFKPKLKNYDEYEYKHALAYKMKQDFDKAESLFINIVKEKSSKTLNSYYELGLIKYYNRKYSEAVKYWFEYLKREKRKSNIVKIKYLIANAYESNEELKKAYNIYYSLLGEYPNPKVLKKRLEALYERRVARKR